MEAQEFFQNTFCPQFPSDNTLTPSISNTNNLSSATDHFIVEDFFDFSNEDDATAPLTDATFDSLPATDDSPTVTPVDSTNTSNFLPDANFSGDLSVPQYDDLAELEWLSKFAEESFSSEDMEKLQLISGVRVQNDTTSSETTPELDSNPVFNPHVSIRGKARSKRSRGGPTWAVSSLVVLSPTATMKSSHSSPHPDTDKKPAPRRRDDGGEGRKCLHCATDKTPQWRTGPMGPKTLCNACGVRFKSGRLVPEYRPAASPTFVLTKHSNSHRKVMELRRQKEMVKVQQHQLLQLQHQQSMMFDPSNGDDYLIHQHVGPDFTHLI